MCSDSPPPTAESIARRLIVLKFIVGYAVTTPPRDVMEKMIASLGPGESKEFAAKASDAKESYWGSFREFDWWDSLTPQEQEFANATIITMTVSQQVDFSWRIEALQVLMWALGLVSELPTYDVLATHDLLRVVPGIGDKNFLESASLRSLEDVRRARSTAELWHWRYRTRGLIENNHPFESTPKMKKMGLGSLEDIVRFTAKKSYEDGTIPEIVDEDFGANGKAYRDLTPDEWSTVHSVTVERHYALNWLCGYAPENSWDETPTDT